MNEHENNTPDPNTPESIKLQNMAEKLFLKIIYDVPDGYDLTVAVSDGKQEAEFSTKPYKPGTPGLLDNGKWRYAPLPDECNANNISDGSELEFEKWLLEHQESMNQYRNQMAKNNSYSWNYYLQKHNTSSWNRRRWGYRRGSR